MGIKRKMKQTTLYNLFESDKNKLLTQRDKWLLAGEYKILKELPSVEGGLKKEMIEDLKVQRILARQNFRGVIADKPIKMTRKFDTIYVETPNAFNLTIDNAPFTPNKMPLLTHLSISREEIIKQANALYEKQLRERERR